MNITQIIHKYERKADSIIARVQKRINTSGAYENAGQREIRLFEDSLPSFLHYTDECHLKDYINNGIDNLRY